MTTQAITHGQTWRLTAEPESPTWTVVGLRGGQVSLSGPGPCRGMKTVELEEFKREWQRIETGRKKRR